tara:strand:+ start:630 stop:1595 length:966 start_codon:yes stop_codon:yes gene_type:complete
MADGILTLNPNFPERNLEGEKLPLIEAPVGAGIGLVLANMFKKRGIGDNNPPSPIEEEKPPQKKPPKEPNVGEEILTDLATRELEKKISKEKDPEDKKSMEYLKGVNEFYAKSIKKRNEENPQLKNLPKLVEADKHFGAAANSFEGFEESQLIYMSPQKYLDLTKDYRPEEQSKLSKVNSDNIKNLLKEGKELANYLYLYVKKSGNDYEVSGQEGIHRAIAFKELGYDEIPVVIQGVGKDQLTGLENKVFTATPRSYLYKQPFTQEHIGFIPERITSNEESFRVMPDDIREVKSKQILFAEGYPFDRPKKADGGVVELLNL